MASISYPSGACIRYSHPNGWVAFLSTATTKTVRTIDLVKVQILAASLPKTSFLQSIISG